MDVLASMSVPMRPLLPVSFSDVMVRIHDNVTTTNDQGAVLNYYETIVNCLEGALHYHLGCCLRDADILTDAYGIALGHCMTQTSLRHVYFCDASTCYRASAYQVSYLSQDFDIPSPRTPPLETINILDYMIALLIVVLMLAGCGCAMLKLEIIHNNELYRKMCSVLNKLGLDCLLDSNAHDSRAVESCELVSTSFHGLEEA